jgi:hypothetical protein
VFADKDVLAAGAPKHIDPKYIDTVTREKTGAPR